jgi:hypothetical protein
MGFGGDDPALSQLISSVGIHRIFSESVMYAAGGDKDVFEAVLKKGLEVAFEVVFEVV